MEALILDELFDPVDNEHLSVLVYTRHIAGVEESLAINTISGLAGIVEVAFHHVGTFDP